MKSQNPHFTQIVFGNLTKADGPDSAQTMMKIIKQGEHLRRTATLPTQRQLMAFFTRLFDAWSNPHYALRRDAAAVLTNHGMSARVVEIMLDQLPALFAPERILKKIEGELGHVLAMERPIPQAATGGAIFAYPVGLVLHVVAGNVSLSVVESLIDGIITKNINFLKMSSEDREFPIIFAQSILECDVEKIIRNHLAVLGWRGGDDTIETLFKQSMDRIVLWGGNDALMHWKKDLGLKTMLIQHGAKVSIGIVSQRGLQLANIKDLAERIAFDTSIWDQKACNSPQIIYVEGKTNPTAVREFLDALALSLEGFATTMPPSGRTSDDDVEVLRFRELAFAKDCMTHAELFVEGPKELDWTIIYERKSLDLSFDLSPLNRTIIIRHYDALAELGTILLDQHFYMQTVGYCLAPEEIDLYAMALSHRGVTRMCPFGAMTLPIAGAPHDGTYALRDLTRFITLEMPTF